MDNPDEFTTSLTVYSDHKRAARRVMHPILCVERHDVIPCVHQDRGRQVLVPTRPDLDRFAGVVCGRRGRVADVGLEITVGGCDGDILAGTSESWEGHIWRKYQGGMTNVMSSSKMSQNSLILIFRYSKY